MNRTEAEKATNELMEMLVMEFGWNGPGSTGGHLAWDRVADIIERAGGQDAEPIWLVKDVAEYKSLTEIPAAREVAATAYQICGALEAPARILDYFSAVASGETAENPLPFTPERPCGETSWVSVEERLPTESGNYLCFLDKSQLSQVTVSFYGDELFDADLENVGRVTYWASLPSPPTVEEKKELFDRAAKAQK